MSGAKGSDVSAYGRCGRGSGSDTGACGSSEAAAAGADAQAKAAWAFEWCGCVYESGHSVVSLHASCEGAYRAMRERLLAEWTERRESDIRHGKNLYGILTSQAWRVRRIELLP